MRMEVDVMVDSKSVLTINSDSFDKVISRGITLVDFWQSGVCPAECKRRL